MWDCAGFHRYWTNPAPAKQLATVIMEVSRREYRELHEDARFTQVMDTEEFGNRVAGTLVESIQLWLHDIGRGATHPRRKQFDDLSNRFIGKLKGDPEYASPYRGLEAPVSGYACRGDL